MGNVVFSFPTILEQREAGQQGVGGGQVSQGAASDTLNIYAFP